MDGEHGYSQKSSSSEGPASEQARKDRRRMVRSELLGQHTHQTVCGKSIHIWQRAGKFIARGYVDGKRFGETLGEDPKDAAARLRRLMVEIENQAYLRPSDKTKRPLARSAVPRLKIRELADDFLAEKRKTRGSETASDYRARLVPLIEFAESSQARRTWQLAQDIDRDFAIALKAFLHRRKVTPNGRPSAQERPMAPGQVFNILDCSRSLLNWAKNPAVNRLPSNFVNPFDKEIVGSRPAKDPLRRPAFPMQRRIELVRHMDLWQLSHLAFAMVLPLRPEDYTGLLISEVDFDEQLLGFGTRWQGRDFNKGRLSFVTPFPPEIVPLISVCVSGRSDGPLLRKRTVFEKTRRPELPIKSPDDVVGHIERSLAVAPAETIENEQDQKVLIRRALRRMGGVSPNSLAKEFKGLLAKSGLPPARFYELRGSINTELNDAGVSHLVQRYVTGHSTRDILNAYVSLDPAAEMQKHFDHIQPLLQAITTRTGELGLMTS